MSCDTSHIIQIREALNDFQSDAGTTHVAAAVAGTGQLVGQTVSIRAERQQSALRVSRLAGRQEKAWKPRAWWATHSSHISRMRE
jgi:hypothetical protein